MANIQYNEIIKSTLGKAGYSDALLDALTEQIITIADQKGVNALNLLGEMVENNIDLKKSKDFIKNIPQTTNGMSYTTFRHSNPKSNRFVERQIIIR